MRPEHIQNKRILFAALNWGMGHVARSIPLLQQLQQQGNELFIAGNEVQIHVFKQYLSIDRSIPLSDYPFRFRGKGRFVLDLILSYPKLRVRLRKERSEVEDLVKQLNIDLVISDHRYGFRSDEVKSICITHQLNLPVPGVFAIAQNRHQKLLKKFDHLWIPDLEDSSLAGDLSINSKGYSCSYIGALSRFATTIQSKEVEGIVVIVSGPKPYNQQLIDHVLDTRYSEELTFIAPECLSIPAEFKRIDGSDWIKQDKIILQSRKIITRSGYSSIMDNYFLNKEIEYIPTPGQREQGYLFKLHSGKANKDLIA